MDTERNDTGSLLMYVGSMLIFGTIGIFRRYIPISSALLACIRGLAGALFLIAFVKLRKKPIRHNIGKVKTMLLVLTGGLISLNWILLFEAYNYTTVATATLCYYMQPTIVIILSPLILREKITVKKGICALVAIVGMVFVSGVVDSGIPDISELKGIFLGLGAAFLYAAVIFLNKKLPGIDPFEKTIIQLFSAAIVLVPYLAITEDFSSIDLNVKVLIMLFIVGFIHTGVAYTMYFGSMDRLKAHSVAILSYIDPISALILSALILKESMSVFEIIGAVLIIGTAIMGEVSPKKKQIGN